VAAFPAESAATHQRLLAKKIVAGLPLDAYYPELADHYLLCATETSTREDLDLLVEEVKHG
jgi:glycine dehydrogenase subunit 1